MNFPVGRQTWEELHICSVKLSVCSLISKSPETLETGLTELETQAALHLRRVECKSITWGPCQTPPISVLA